MGEEDQCVSPTALPKHILHFLQHPHLLSFRQLHWNHQEEGVRSWGRQADTKPHVLSQVLLRESTAEPVWSFHHGHPSPSHLPLSALAVLGLCGCVCECVYAGLPPKLLCAQDGVSCCPLPSCAPPQQHQPQLRHSRRHLGRQSRTHSLHCYRVRHTHTHRQRETQCGVETTARNSHGNTDTHTSTRTRTDASTHTNTHALIGTHRHTH